MLMTCIELVLQLPFNAAHTHMHYHALPAHLGNLGT